MTNIRYANAHRAENALCTSYFKSCTNVYQMSFPNIQLASPAERIMSRLLCIQILNSHSVWQKTHIHIISFITWFSVFMLKYFCFTTTADGAFTVFFLRNFALPVKIATCAKWILSAIFNKSFGHCWEIFGQNGITRNHVTADKNDNICNRNNCKKSMSQKIQS